MSCALLQPISARDALSLPGLDKALLSDADLRVRGFGLPDGLSSLAGDLAERTPPPPAAAAASTAAAAAACSSSLVGRFNRHSQRLLLQQLLQPAAAAAATSDAAGPREKVQLLVQQEQQLRKHQGAAAAAAAAAAAGVPAADPRDAATREASPLSLLGITFPASCLFLSSKGL